MLYGSSFKKDFDPVVREAEIKPHGVGNDLSGKAMAAVQWVRVCRGLSSHSEFHVPLS